MTGKFTKHVAKKQPCDQSCASAASRTSSPWIALFHHGLFRVSRHHWTLGKVTTKPKSHICVECMISGRCSQNPGVHYARWYEGCAVQQWYKEGDFLWWWFNYSFHKWWPQTGISTDSLFESHWNLMYIMTWRIIAIPCMQLSEAYCSWSYRRWAISEPVNWFCRC